MENPRVSGLSNTESNSPVLVIIGALSALLLFFIILIVIVLVAIRRRYFVWCVVVLSCYINSFLCHRKTTKVKMQDVVLASPTSPRIYVRYRQCTESPLINTLLLYLILCREKPVQPMAENVYADVDTVGHPTSHAV